MVKDLATPYLGQKVHIAVQFLQDIGKMEVKF